MIHKHVPNPDKSASKHIRIGALLGYISNPDDGAKCIRFGLSPAFISDDVPGAILEMTANAEGAVRSRDTIHHVVLSWPADERPTPEQAAEAVRIYIKHIGFQDHLYAWALHDDTDNSHLHIVLDRATPEGTVRKINRGFTQIAGAEAIALIEAAQGWRPEANAMVTVLEDGTLARSSSQRESSDLAPSPPQHVADQAAHDGNKTQIETVQEQIGDLFRTAEKWSELHAGLSKHGLRYERKGSGAIIWLNDEEALKASSISRHASLAKLEKRLGPLCGPEDTPTPAPLEHRPPPPAAEAAERVAGEDLAEAFEAYHAAVDADRYRVTSIRLDPQTGKQLVMILDKRAGETIGFTPDELRDRLCEMARLDARGENLYLTPLSAHHHHLIVDDMASDDLATLKAQGVSPAAVLESSPGNFQTVVKVPREASDDLDRKAANALVREINQELGDPNFSGAIHPHRMPGSRNQKPKHRRHGKSPIVRIVEAAGGVCQVMAERLRSLYQGFASAAQARRTSRKAPPKASDLPRPSPVATVSDPEALALYEAHRKDVTRLFRKADDLSRLDAMIADRLAATGLSEAEVAACIEAGLLAAGNRVEKHDRARDYAARTAAHAFEHDTIARRAEKFAQYFVDWQAITDAARSQGVSEIDMDVENTGEPDVEIR